MTMPPEGPGRARQSQIYRSGVLGHRPAVPTDFDELARRAELEMSPRGWAYVSGGAGLGTTMRANRAAWWRSTTRRYRTEPLVISGPGAGAEVTAAGILNDIYSLSPR